MLVQIIVCLWNGDAFKGYCLMFALRAPVETADVN